MSQLSSLKSTFEKQRQLELDNIHNNKIKFQKEEIYFNKKMKSKENDVEKSVKYIERDKILIASDWERLKQYEKDLNKRKIELDKELQKESEMKGKISALAEELVQKIGIMKNKSDKIYNSFDNEQKLIKQNINAIKNEKDKLRFLEGARSE